MNIENLNSTLIPYEINSYHLIPCCKTIYYDNYSLKNLNSILKKLHSE